MLFLTLNENWDDDDLKNIPRPLFAFTFLITFTLMVIFWPGVLLLEFLSEDS